MTDDEMKIRLEVLDLCARYNWHTDLGQADQVAQLFTDDGVFDIAQGRFEGRDAIEAFNRSIHKQIRGAYHFNDNHLFEIADDHVRHKSYMHLIFAPDAELPPLLSTYDDIIVRTSDGGWAFQSRIGRPLIP